MNAANSSGVLPAGSVPSPRAWTTSSSCDSGDLAETRLMIAGGCALCQQAGPGAAGEAGDALLDEGRHLGQHRQAALGGHADQRTWPVLPGLIRPEAASNSSWIWPPIRSCSAAAAPSVRDVDHVGLRQRLQQLGRQVRRRAVAAGAEAHLAGVLASRRR